MNKLNNDILKKAEIEALFNLYLYLMNIFTPKTKQTMQEIVWELEVLQEEKPDKYSGRDVVKLKILKNAIKNNDFFATSKLKDFACSENGLTAAMFIKPDNSISIAYRGTGCGEWIDNGEGLSGIAEENTYMTYGHDSAKPFIHTVFRDYATDQQVEALNWFNYILSKHKVQNSKITVSGHSKGGNKAQFIAMKSGDVDFCFSFDGQGFSPEAIQSMKNIMGTQHQNRRKKIYSICADNDYVNVLGNQLPLVEQTYYFKSISGIHSLESILQKDGTFNPQCEQGKLSVYVQTISEEIMSLSPFVRQYATLGIMNIFQKHLGKCETVNGDAVSIEKTIAGISIAAGIFLNHLRKSKKDTFIIN